MINQRETAIAVYRRIEADGLLSRARMRVFEVLSRIGPATSSMMARDLATQGATRATLKNVDARITELHQMGTVAEASVGPCAVTGETVTYWDVTGEMPARLERVATKADIIRALAGPLAAAAEGLRQLETQSPQSQRWLEDADAALRAAAPYLRRSQ